MMRLTAIKTILIVLLLNSISAAMANSVGFGQGVYSQSSGQVTVDIVYDFTNFPMFAAGVDVIYDASFLEFVSFTQGPFASDVHPAVSPTGLLTQPGVYTGAGIGYLGPFSGINSAGGIGTFVFSVIGTPTNSTPCGAALCLQGNANNPFISLMGIDVTEELLNNGFNSAEVVVPLPAAIWFLMSGVVVLAGLSRK